ncbi:hypothetical protein [Bradyrhizobium sp.]|uniref:hypothetical protein n=1 Tax=Bradyrhizobium sp. TaxID=376 RepID=UPI00260F0DDA|nr:hypothetical protein [Bradyrhizobium sp.]
MSATSICARPGLDSREQFAVVYTLLSRWVRQPPLGRLQRAPAARSANPPSTLSTQDMISKLKAMDMPISALSEMLDVERKTIYSWLDDGVEAKSGNYDRLRAIYDLFADESAGSLRFYHRFWQRGVVGDRCLRDLLVAPEIDRVAVRVALDALRPAVERAMQADAGRKRNSRERSPASSLTLHLTAGSSN